MPDFLNTENILLVQKSLDALWLRQKVISNNLANADTPGYKSQSVVFEDVLSRALQTGDAQEKLKSLQPKIVKNSSTQVREDGNNVDKDEQNIELTRAQMQYECMVRLISEDIRRMKYAISGGR